MTKAIVLVLAAILVVAGIGLIAYKVIGLLPRDHDRRDDGGG